MSTFCFFNFLLLLLIKFDLESIILIQYTIFTIIININKERGKIRTNII